MAISIAIPFSKSSERKGENVESSSSSRSSGSLRDKVLATPKAQAKIKEVRKKFRDGKLKMGKSGKRVTSSRQATAIALSEAQWEGYKRRSHAKNNHDADVKYGAYIARKKKVKNEEKNSKNTASKSKNKKSNGRVQRRRTPSRKKR